MIEWRRQRRKGVDGPSMCWATSRGGEIPNGKGQVPREHRRQGPGRECQMSRQERCSKANGGCQSFTRKGTNAYYSVVTCLECGHGERTKIAEVATHTFETCPHDQVDRRGSTKTMCMIYCKQCCSYIDTRGRAEVERVEKTNAKFVMASTEQQKPAARLWDEQNFTKDDIARMFEVFKGMLQEYMRERPGATSTEIKSILEDAIDCVKAEQRRHAYVGLQGEEEDNLCPLIKARDEFFNITYTPSSVMPTTVRNPSSELPTVDVMKDPGIWVVMDEGCNSMCHSRAWAENAEMKLEKLGMEFEWINRTSKIFNGIGGAKVHTHGKRRIPTACRLVKSGMVILGSLEPHEQDGTHPLLLSDIRPRRGWV